MTAEITNPGFMPPEMAADCDALIEHLMSRKPLDPEVYRRVRERAERVTEEIFRKHGVLDIAADLVRKARSEQ